MCHYRSPFNSNRQASKGSIGDLSFRDNDISFVSSGRTSSEHMYSPYDFHEFGGPPRLSIGSDSEHRMSTGSPFSASKSPDLNSTHGFSSSSEGGNMSWASSQNQVCSNQELYLRINRVRECIAHSLKNDYKLTILTDIYAR